MDKTILNKKILDHVGKAWSEGKTPLLLSRLGAREDGEIARAARGYASSLSEYLKQELADEVRVVNHSATPVVVAAVPRSSETESIHDFDPLLEKSLRRADAEGKPNRFHQVFWLAFRKPLKPGKRRFVIPSDRLEFLDVSEDDASPGNGVEIDREFIATEVGDVLHEDTYSRIVEWGKKNSVSLDQFFHSAVAKRYKRHLRERGISLLDQIFEVLDPEDLRRMNLPMDVVRKLARTRT